MRTSRISKETAKVVAASSLLRRQTRSSAAAAIINASAVEPLVGIRAIADDGDDDDDDSDDSSLSSVPSVASLDMEDHFRPATKRKRGRDRPATTVTVSTAVSSTRTSPPRKARSKQQDDGDEPEEAQKTKKKQRRRPARKVTNDAGEVDIHPPTPPSDWEEMYDCVRAMRQIHRAPVDTMGCERIAEEHRSPKDQRFQTLIALMLSSQTKDTTNAQAMRRLQTELPPPGGLSLANILAVEPATLNALIHAVGFHNDKTRHIKAAAQRLHAHFHDDIPDTVDGLRSLPGVGPKMAYLCMSAAWGRTEGIGVDVHVHRITNRWGWHGPGETRGPEETRARLESWLPRERWHEINHLLVGFGQTICLPVGRRCGDCALAARGLCKSAVGGGKAMATAKAKAKARRRMVEVGVEGEEGVEVKEEGEEKVVVVVKEGEGGEEEEVAIAEKVETEVLVKREEGEEEAQI